MQIIPQSVNLLDTDSLHSHKFSAQAKHSQYGKYSDSVDAHGGDSLPVPLLAIPSESLTHITAFLDPGSLFALGRANKILHEHINDDNTWRKAFACQFLGERPERSDLQQSILLRRNEDSWKREFVLRCNLIRRWERCRTGTVSHTPHYSPIAAMHLLSDRSYGPSLLSVSLQYGIVARSFPLNGKVLKGFITASDGFGIGNGNPNAEFTPNVTACTVATEGWTARVVFGFANGEVALASAMRVMEPGHTANRVTRCLVDEQHRGLVTSAAWDSQAFVTAGTDGEARVWDARRLRCIYVLQDQRNIIPDPCVHVLSDLDRGVVLAAKQSGTAVIWHSLTLADERSETAIVPSTIQVARPLSNAEGSKEPSYVFIDQTAPSGQLCYGIHYAGDMHFYRVNVNLSSGQTDITQFGEGPLAPIQTVCPSFASDEGAKTVICVGDALGRVSLFDWSSQPEQGKKQVPALRVLDATADGIGISAIACNAYVLAVGTVCGVTKVYDTLTFEHLREFPSPIPRPNTNSTPVKEIVIEKDLLFASVGERILAWEAKPVRPHKPLTVKKASGKGRNAKWHKRLELAQDISESRKAVEDVQKYERRSHERRRAHHAALAGLGLDEQEALQYVLMLSRDEGAQQGSVAEHQESVFETDFEDVGHASASRSSSNSETDHEERSSANDASPPLEPADSRTAEQVQLLVHSEPMGAGIAVARRSESGSAPPSVGDPDHFPAISSSVSSTLSARRQSPPALSSSWSSRVKASSSSSPTPSISVPGSAISVGASSMRRNVSGPSFSTANSSRPSLLSETLRLYNQGQAGYDARSTGMSVDEDEEVDADLKLALELSMVEALSLKDV